MQFSTPLFFLNKERFKEKILNECLWLQAVHGKSESDYVPIHTMIVDCSSISFVDTSGVTSIIEVRCPSARNKKCNVMHSVSCQLAQELGRKNVTLILASCNPEVLSTFQKMELKRNSANIVIFSCVSEAVRWTTSCRRHQQPQ